MIADANTSATVVWLLRAAWTNHKAAIPCFCTVSNTSMIGKYENHVTWQTWRDMRYVPTELSYEKGPLSDSENRNCFEMLLGYLEPFVANHSGDNLWGTLCWWTLVREPCMISANYNLIYGMPSDGNCRNHHKLADDSGKRTQKDTDPNKNKRVYLDMIRSPGTP